MAHVLYRFYSATGQLLYVGITMNPPQRFKAHRDSKDWWPEVAGISIEHYASRTDLANAERRAIQVERPLHNVVHTKKRPLPKPPAPEPRQFEIDDDISALFRPPEPVSFDSLFGRERYRDTRFGYVTDEQYQECVAAERVKAEARADCSLCDSSGYRPNMRVCDHVDRSPGLRSAQREVQKERLSVIEGGG